ncbi:MAG TPA: hypothetical protein VHF45_01525, partial [Thermoleophilaceae bacterium]|nr:hypothetical protein [Thermoleophilaceae bacterium]
MTSEAGGARRQRGGSLTTPIDTRRPGVTDFVHAGLVLEGLDETVRFRSLLGFDCGEPGVFGGEWVGRIVGLE